ncbi:basic helix-loop-helix (bHLH) DNA-binding superfamily protein [Rhynchospora pubera]|uniref:Basic helix-loop-helix (BHLH) DNA-binding superfamily protein n=1 Tax=Rhynchospora pubera TaxID=906938 RepID=A0AAV8CVG7_9POAL|nr:basic helix-loop-helix (bHLH) DNA-binding superfamily protein [Rhynchospora pubera]
MDQWSSQGAPTTKLGRPPDGNQLDPSFSARKVQKADREKMRRDRLNEQFQELGNALDPERPKNDKVTILSDAIQVLKDLNAEVNRLKAEYASLSEESRELTQEKNELRDEKATLKSDIDSLNAQYQQRLRMSYPWAGLDHPVVMGPYPFPVPVPIPSTAVPVQPYPFYRPYFPFPQSCNNAQPGVDTSVPPQTGNNRCDGVVSEEASRSKRSDECSDVATELELKMPGYVGPSHSKATSNKDSSTDVRKKQQWSRESSSSRSSSSSVQDSSCNSITVDGSASNNN